MTRIRWKRGFEIHQKKKKKNGERQKDMIRVECKSDGKHDKGNGVFLLIYLFF